MKRKKDSALLCHNLGSRCSHLLSDPNKQHTRRRFFVVHASMMVDDERWSIITHSSRTSVLSCSCHHYQIFGEIIIISRQRESMGAASCHIKQEDELLFGRICLGKRNFVPTGSSNSHPSLFIGTLPFPGVYRIGSCMCISLFKMETTSDETNT
jgi:hypothetical protein